jgi:hypothetical protein
MMRKTMSIRALTLLVGLFAGAHAMAIETPNYSVVSKVGDIEYRQYETHLVVETLVAGDYAYKASGNEGFRRLFRYITGANEGSQKVAMTSPVSRVADGEKISMTSPVARESSSEGEVVAFMLPSQFTLATAPVPTDPRVSVREVPGRLMAVVRYSGRWTDSNYEERKRILLAGVAAGGAEVIGEVQSALYDAPYIPPFMRRNEVLIQIKALPTGQSTAAAALPLAL